MNLPTFPVRFSQLALSRDPGIEGMKSSLVRAVSEVAEQFSVPVTKLVVRGNHSVESEDDIYNGLILDVYLNNDISDQSKFSERLVKKTDSLTMSQLSVFVHAR